MHRDAGGKRLRPMLQARRCAAVLEPVQSLLRNFSWQDLQACAVLPN